MLEVASAMILYVLGFPFLYGVLRLAVRHGMVDAARLAREEELDAPRHPMLMEGTITG
ncbi:hypothetical protein O7627_36095 [Solwaraspora sp. WMMD1047]|uniref:hypothetical protein n=1 Tax=Solwaraspora sp. WMMD1047 TaxID=3016102 RepID=UPI0024176063|nr:hypothetical protein [Solwaraspora sp. WMMD1047]MDG4834693.1 hypothetical protein [Solwaraspora sp. WMMD1047]